MKRTNARAAIEEDAEHPAYLLPNGHSGPRRKVPTGAISSFKKLPSICGMVGSCPTLG